MVWMVCEFAWLEFMCVPVTGLAKEQLSVCALLN